MEGIAVTPSQLLFILKRRWLSLLISFSIVVLAGGMLAYMLPPTYKSTATILIEEPEMPANNAATVSSYAEQRIQQLTQRIMTFPRLMEIIERLNLYGDVRANLNAEEIVEWMRRSTELKVVSAESYDPYIGRTTTGAIAFTLSYQGRKPETVLEVVRLLTDLYLEENLKVRTQRAEETSEFLETETARLKQELAEIDARISGFKKTNIQVLPELMQMNLQALAGIERNIELVSEQLRAQREREGFLQAQLAGVRPHLEKEDELFAKRRLEELNVQLVALRQRFSEDHPDVRKTRAEIAELEKRISHLGGKATRGEPDNPAYITLFAQLAGVRIELQGLQRQLDKLKAEGADYRRRIAGTPKVEAEYNALLAVRDSTNSKVNEMMRKLMDARVSHGLEKEQRGERFTLIEPPRFPEKPFKPKRRLIVLVAAIIGIGLSGGIAALREVTDDAIYSSEQLEVATGYTVLAGIPRIEASAQ